MRKERSNSPRPENAPPPLLGFQKQKARVPFGLSSGSCSSLGCFHFLHSTHHPEKMTHIRIRIFSVSQNLRKVGYPSLFKPSSGNLSLHQREKHGLSHPFCLRQEGWGPCHMLTSLMWIKEVFGATGKFYFQENFSTKARFYFMSTYSIPTFLLHRCFLRKSLRGKKILRLLIGHKRLYFEIKWDLWCLAGSLCSWGLCQTLLWMSYISTGL